jgi:hypothetical protein
VASVSRLEHREPGIERLESLARATQGHRQLAHAPPRIARRVRGDDADVWSGLDVHAALERALFGAPTDFDGLFGESFGDPTGAACATATVNAASARSSERRRRMSPLHRELAAGAKKPSAARPRLPPDDQGNRRAAP